MTIWNLNRQCLTNLRCFSQHTCHVPQLCVQNNNSIVNSISWTANWLAVNFQSVGEICNMHSSDIYISLNSGTPLALHFTFVSIWGKRVIVNQTHHFQLVVSFLLIQHSTSLWRGRIWQAQLFHRAHPHQQHSSSKKQFQHNHRCTQGLTRFGTRDTCRPMRLAQPAWHSVV